jgi:hypothetical protein
LVYAQNKGVKNIMNLLIKMDSGQPVDHPIMEENARQAWPDVDFDNLPSWLSRFRRVAQPSLEEMPVGVFQRAKCTYVIASDSVVEDSWSVEDMTAEEQQVLTRQRRTQLRTDIDASILIAQTRAAEEGIPAEAVAAWNNYLAILQAVTDADLVDPFEFQWPQGPTIASDGYPVV